MWNFNDRRKRADAGGAATVGNEGMNVYNGAAPIEFIEHRLVFAIAQPLVPVARLEATARKSRRLIGGKATAIDPHAHRFAASDNLPTPRGRIGRLADSHYVIAPMLQLAAHGLQF